MNGLALTEILLAEFSCLLLDMASAVTLREHRIIERCRLEKTLKISESNHEPNTVTYIMLLQAVRKDDQFLREEGGDPHSHPQNLVSFGLSHSGVKSYKFPVISV